jgi:5-methylcytosine-specific restriction endonuclease McrA
MNHQRIPESKRSAALSFYYQNLEANRAKARERAKARYYANKEAKLLKNAEYRRNHPDKWKLIKQVSNKKYHKRRFFFSRALHHAVRVNDQDEAKDLCAVFSRAWYNQRGRCAYTGKKLDRSAQIDHKIPTSRGGTNDASNIHWVTADANWVKRDRTHDEFVSICSDITAYIEANKHPSPTRRSSAR